MRVLLIALAALAGLFGAAGVALAAIGAHLSANPTVTTAAYFLLFHAGALIGLCAIARDRRDRLLLTGAALIAAGAILFSGDLALRALAGLKLVAMAAPTGGVLMILGWTVVALALPICLGRSENERQ